MSEKKERRRRQLEALTVKLVNVLEEIVRRAEKSGTAIAKEIVEPAHAVIKEARRI